MAPGRRWICLQFTIYSLLGSFTSAEICYVKDFGALGGGQAVETAALQATLDACTSLGDVVEFEPNVTYLTGSLTVRGGARVHLPAGTRLLASDQRSDYGPTIDDWYLLRLDGCQGCSIEGEGTIDGNAQAFVEGQIPGDRKLVRNWDDPSCANPKQCRPRLVGLTNSTQVLVHGVTLVDCAFWCLHMFNSSGVTVQGVNITADFDIPNNDGIDVDGSSHVLIQDCVIFTADDGVCIKTTKPGLVTSDVNVTNCHITSKSAAVKIGSESQGNMHTMQFTNLQIARSHRGLGIQVRDQGNLSDVLFSHISIQTQLYNRTWWGGGEPIYVTAGPRRWNQPVTGSVSGVKFDNISIQAEAGVVVVGHPHHPMDVDITRVTMKLVRVTQWAGGYRDLRPGFLQVQEGVRVPALYVANASSLSINEFSVVVSQQDRPEWGELLHTVPGTVWQLKLGPVEFADQRASPPAAMWPDGRTQAVLHLGAAVPTFT